MLKAPLRQKGETEGRKRQLRPSSLGPLDATSKVPSPLWQTEVRQHKRHRDVAMWRARARHPIAL